LAAVALAYHAGADFESMAASLPRFEGIARRMALRGEGRGVTILDDYAHHPTEIRVTLEAARSRYSPKRTLVVFQPHQHSRTRLLLNEFAQSLSGVDEVFIPDVYTARSVAPSLGHNGSTEAGDAAASAAGHATGEDAGRDAAAPIGSRALVSRLRDAGASARYVPELNDVAHRVAEDLREGDLVMTMGAGDVWKVADELVARIC
ncbi:MAG: glutamate ligase domain-containing protein, partial [Phycisphaerae bacterium]